MTASINGTTGVTYPDGSTQSTAATSGLVNKIINGRMEIDQRNAGAAVSNINGYSVDRFYVMRGNSSSNPVFNAQQSTTVPAGFKNSLAITVGTSGAPGTSNYSVLYQRIEGYNCSDLGYGAAGASTVTLSFWVNCSVTGTYGVALQNNANTRSYIGTYTVNAANTWEQKTITVAGDTSGTWLTDNNTGIGIYWDIGVGTTQSTTAGSWQTGNYIGLTSGTKLSNTNGATFYITGVQLEKGSTATSFDYRPYGQELALCQRYLPAWNDGTALVSFSVAANLTRAVLPLPVTTRVPVTGITVNNLANFSIVNAGTPSSISFQSGSSTSVALSVGFTGLTAGTPYYIVGASSSQILGTGCEL